MGAEDATFIGLETGLTMDLAFLRYTMSGATGFLSGLTDLTDLTAPETIVTREAGGNLEYQIAWELGTAASPNTLLEASLPADIYVTNVFLNLAPQ